jgi:hypothetical protein
MINAELESPVDLLIDDEADERGNVMMAAMFIAGTAIALTFNAN